ncbi:hypothetical protein ACFO6R_16005 [Eubacterium multiforme]|uniref:Uncharacterized protein n=1 Tax=Eubacterium multiforme TaxID=83339 RepID=A0ABT9UTL1_9FIRM|nr:hypothetical protein [Eubacterium multiforme]MDQ0149634.1 hypothetical protein [Eubacterium multiforme]
MRDRLKKLSLWKIYNETKTIYIVWNDSDEILKYILDKNIFLNKIFYKRKVAVKSKILISIDNGKNYYYIPKILNILNILNNKLKEPYILDNCYIYGIK